MYETVWVLLLFAKEILKKKWTNTPYIRSEKDKGKNEVKLIFEFQQTQEKCYSRGKCQGRHAPKCLPKVKG